jgi:hypothetical protein
MFLGSYRFGGDPTGLVLAYDRMMSGFDRATLDLHICVVEPNALLVLDACPTEEVFRSFSSSPEFRGAWGGAGLPEPAIGHLGTVHEARLRQELRT